MTSAKVPAGCDKVPKYQFLDVLTWGALWGSCDGGCSFTCNHDMALCYKLLSLALCFMLW